MRSFGIINISFVLLVLCYNKAYEHTLPRVLERDPNTGAKLGAGQGEREREYSLARPLRRSFSEASQEVSAPADSLFSFTKKSGTAANFVAVF